jgi:hypothetical protein
VTVAFDAATISNGSLSFSHTPVGTPRGVLYLSYLTADTITAVTYGGVSLTQMTLSPVVKGTGETAEVGAWFLGSSVPTGAQTLAVTITGELNQGACITLTGADDLEEVDTTSISSDSLLNPSGTLSLASRSCFCALVGRSGQNAVGSVAPLTDWTEVEERDMGSQVGLTHRYDTIGTDDVTFGWTAAAEDATALAVAISEVVGGGAPTGRGRLIGGKLVGGNLVAIH